MTKTIKYRGALIEVGDDGVIRQNGKTLKQTNMGHNHEYRYAVARKGKGVRRDTKNVMVNVARAVCRTFNGRPRKGQQVDHIDSNPSNNDFRNLRWVSRKENNTRPHAMEQRAQNRRFTSHRHQIVVLKDSKSDQRLYFRNGRIAADFMGVSHVAVYVKAGTTRRIKYRWYVDFVDIKDLPNEVLSQVIE